MPKPPRWKRALRLTGKIFAFFLVGLVLVIGLALISINLSPLSGWIATRVNATLEPMFEGRVVLRKLGYLDFGGILGADVEVLDPAGQTVLVARDVDVRLSVLSVAWNAVAGSSNTLSIPIDRIALESLDVNVIDDGSGSPTLANAFTPKETPPKEESEGSTALEVESLLVGTTRVRGALPSVGPIDTDLEHLEANLVNDARGTHLVLQKVDVAARGLPKVDSVTGRLTADVTLPATPEPAAPGAPPNGASAGRDPSTNVYALSPAPPPRRILAGFVGSIAGSAAALDLRMLGEELAATFDAESLSPATVEKLVPGLSPKAPLALSSKVEGALDDLGFEAKLRQRAAEVNARGRFKQVEKRSEVTARVDAAAVNLADLMAGGASTHLNLGANASLSFGERGGEGSYRLVSAGSRFGAEVVPETTIDGKLRMPTEAPMMATGTVHVAEPGAPTDIEYDVTSGESGTVADVKSTTRVNRPARVQQLTGGLLATGEIGTKAHFDSGADQLDAEVRVRLRDLQHPQVRARELDASALARGSAKTPNLELLLNLTGVTASGRKWSRVRVAAKGNTEELNTTLRAWGDQPDLIEVRAVVMPSSDRPVRSPEVTINDSEGKLVIRAADVRMQGEKVRVEHLTLVGPGRADLSLSYGPGLERLDLETQQLDAGTLLRMFGIKSELKSGKLDVSAKFENGRRPSGKLLLGLNDVGFGKLKGGKARADFTLDRGTLSGDAALDLDRGAKTEIALTGVKLPLGPMTERTLDNLTGDVSIKGDFDLARLQALLPYGGIERAEGRLKFDLEVQRSPETQKPPVWRAHIQSQRLVLVGQRPDVSQKQDAERARATSPWALRGIDIDLTAALEKHAANIRGRIFDRRGDIVALAAEWKDIEGVRDLTDPRRTFANAPFTAQISVPRRAFERLPAPIRPADVQGTLALEVNAEGTLTTPRVQARGRIEKLRPATEEKAPKGLDVELRAEYAQAGGSLRLDAHDRERIVLGLGSRWTGDVATVMNSVAAKSPVSGDFSVELTDFPVEIVPALLNRHIKGTLSGSARLDGFGKDARLAVDLQTKRLYIDRLLVDEVVVRVKNAGAKLDIDTRFAGRGGTASAKASTGMTWGNRVVPVLDDQLEGSFSAKDFRLSALLPLVDDSVSELDGKLDADIRASLEGGTPRLTGRAALTEGALHLPTIGQRFSDIQAKVAITPESIKIDDVRARGISGAFGAKAEATLRGLTAVAAHAELNIDEDEKLPITIEGEAIGDAWGKIETNYEHDESAKLNTIEVNLKKFNVELPAAPPQGIQDLGQAEHIRVGYWRRDQEFVAIPLQPLEAPGEPSEYKTVIVVDLGSLGIEKGQQVEATLGGRIQATLGEELDVQGKIETRRGELDVSGKKFVIERGSVTFTGGPPDDPTISAVARYDSPAGYTVYAEYTGTASRGKLNLRSEPALSQDEILTLLLFGTPDGSFGAGGGGDNLSTAVSVAGGTAAQGVNKALSQVTDLDVQARVDTSTGSPRPELVLQLTPRVAARVTQALGEPSPGQSPDRTFLTVELRLASAWSLSTMIGDRGASALDLIWRRRY